MSRTDSRLKGRIVGGNRLKEWIPQTNILPLLICGSTDIVEAQ